MLKVENLCASYNGKKVFENVSFSLNQNSITALCGLNGSGKSTLLSLMSGICFPSLKISGKVLLDGKNILKQSPKITAKQISYLVQDEHSAWNINVEKLVDGGRFVHRKWYEESNQLDKKIITKSLCSVSLEDYEKRFISTLSGGEYQRARLARSFAQQTPYIFLDEPLAAIDVIHQKNILQMLKEFCETEDKTICISIHDINLAAQFADYIILMKENRSGIIFGHPDEIINEDSLFQTYGKKFQLFKHPITKKIQIW